MEYECVVCRSNKHDFLYALRDVSFGTPGEWDYVECIECGHGSIFPCPTSHELKELYENLYTPQKKAEMVKIGQSGFDIYLQKRRAKLLASHSRKPPQRILDAGCGMGFSLKKLSEKFPHAKCVGAELSESAATHARSLGGLSIINQDFHEIETTKHDILTFNHVVEHLNDPNSTLRHAHKLLSEDGLLLIEVPISTGWAQSVWRQFWWCHLPPQHLHLFNPSGLSTMVGQHGFEEVERATAAYPFSMSLGLFVYFRARWGSYSVHKEQYWIRLPAFLIGLLLLPLTVVFDLTLSPLLGWFRGDIVTMVFRKVENMPQC